MIVDGSFGTFQYFPRYIFIMQKNKIISDSSTHWIEKVYREVKDFTASVIPMKIHLRYYLGLSVEKKTPERIYMTLNRINLTDLGRVFVDLPARLRRDRDVIEAINEKIRWVNNVAPLIAKQIINETPPSQQSFVMKGPKGGFIRVLEYGINDYRDAAGKILDLPRQQHDAVMMSMIQQDKEFGEAVRDFIRAL
jgi:hypothetical protein